MQWYLIPVCTCLVVCSKPQTSESKPADALRATLQKVLSKFKKSKVENLQVKNRVGKSKRKRKHKKFVGKFRVCWFPAVSNSGSLNIWKVWHIALLFCEQWRCYDNASSLLCILYFVAAVDGESVDNVVKKRKLKNEKNDPTHNHSDEYVLAKLFKKGW